MAVMMMMFFIGASPVLVYCLFDLHQLITHMPCQHQKQRHFFLLQPQIKKIIYEMISETGACRIFLDIANIQKGIPMVNLWKP
jgi:hypothetical protein